VLEELKQQLFHIADGISRCVGLNDQSPATTAPHRIPAVALPAAARGTHGPGQDPALQRSEPHRHKIVPAVKILRSNLWQNATGATTQAGECEEEESNSNGNKRRDRQDMHRGMLYLNAMPVKS